MFFFFISSPMIIRFESWLFRLASRLLQTSKTSKLSAIFIVHRYLVKAYEQAEEGKSLTPTVSYLVHDSFNRNKKWDGTREGFARSFYAVAAGYVIVSLSTECSYDGVFCFVRLLTVFCFFFSYPTR